MKKLIRPRCQIHATHPARAKCHKNQGGGPFGKALIDHSGTLLDNSVRLGDINGTHTHSSRLPVTPGYGILHFCTALVVADNKCHSSLTGFSLFPGSYAPGRYLAAKVVDLNPTVLNS